MTLPVTSIDNDNAIDLGRFRKMILTETDGVQSLLYSGINPFDHCTYYPYLRYKWLEMYTLETLKILKKILYTYYEIATYNTLCFRVC